MATEQDLRALRREYIAEPLLEAGMASDPVEQFTQWFSQARTLQPDSVNAMVLATAGGDGCPAARVVLLKHFDTEGFCWYTDYQSHKGQELAANPQAELLFYWPQLERQVRIWGHVNKLDRSDAESYFGQRPRGSQISAAVSCQSTIIASREDLVVAAVELEERYHEQPIPCPQQWGGYRLIPERFEFWQGRENRLHDRIVYGRQLKGWQLVRLAP